MRREHPVVLCVGCSADRHEGIGTDRQAVREFRKARWATAVVEQALQLKGALDPDTTVPCCSPSSQNLIS